MRNFLQAAKRTKTKHQLFISVDQSSFKATTTNVRLFFEQKQETKEWAHFARRGTKESTRHFTSPGRKARRLLPRNAIKWRPCFFSNVIPPLPGAIYVQKSRFEMFKGGQSPVSQTILGGKEGKPNYETLGEVSKRL